VKRERTPEEKAKVRAIHSGFQVAGGAAFVGCALAAGLVLLSGRAAAPRWLLGGASSPPPRGGRWVNVSAQVAFADWGPEALTLARREGKLVLLFLGPEYNAPTMRMQSSTYSDLSVALQVQARFVAVRVDSAEFPDLDRRYRAGGWPTNALLTSDGDVVAAGTSMSPAVLLRWAETVSDRATPQALARLAASAAERRRAQADDRARAGTPPAPEQAEAEALRRLLPDWDPQRRTFDREGPRFPRFERVAALARLKAGWARDLAAQAARGDWLFLDPRDGGARRSAGPDGETTARERTAAGQAAALDAFCALQPAAARRVLAYVSATLTPRGAPARYLGWEGGYALTKNFFEATDGADLDATARTGWRPVGAARLGDEAELARAVLDCRLADRAARAHAQAVAGRAYRDFTAAARLRDLRLLLDDALGVGNALLAAGRSSDAEKVFRYLDGAFGQGACYLDRRPTGVLPPETDQIADPELNARALAFLERLESSLPSGPARDSARARAVALEGWLAARTDELDPAVWAALVASARPKAP
jgi:hypothetical protein